MKEFKVTQTMETVYYIEAENKEDALHEAEQRTFEWENVEHNYTAEEVA